ncbi:MAG TPA: hypothetical protein VHP11_06735, partial [Tepidisphaeraceae bacterium]|nr:hypothetical protein [Tepidisphaeraceae bacterium]
SAGEAAIVAMERYWAAGGEIYGDLDPKNILCDFSTQSLSFVDPGMPEGTYHCFRAPREWYPASRDLAYMLFDVAASVRVSMANPGIRRRQKAFVEAGLRMFLANIGSEVEKQKLLEEIQACTQVHVGRIPVSWSPVGIFRMLVRQAAAHCVREMLGKLAVTAEGAVCGKVR